MVSGKAADVGRERHSRSRVPPRHRHLPLLAPSGPSLSRVRRVCRSVRSQRGEDHVASEHPAHRSGRAVGVVLDGGASLGRPKWGGGGVQCSVSGVDKGRLAWHLLGPRDRPSRRLREAGGGDRERQFCLARGWPFGEAERGRCI